ncbi:MAG TPA: flagellar type III secretion system pore protein FliP [Kineosporiaceae bacterium]|nr:flagellar type III secretion system pore protein FliP [Kineosporiaceae bacterium]
MSRAANRTTAGVVRRRAGRLALAAALTFGALGTGLLGIHDTGTRFSEAGTAVANRPAAQAIAVTLVAQPLSGNAFEATSLAVRPRAGPQAGPQAGPTAPSPPARPGVTGPTVSVDVPGQPSQVLTILALVTVLGVAPAILLMCTAFTKVVVVLSLARSAIGTQSIPPNQVMVGLALFLSLFVMGPTFDAMQAKGVKPYLDGTKTAQQAYTDAVVPLRDFMLKHTRDEELALMTKAAGRPLPKERTSTDLRSLIPAFVLSELRGAFIIGFVVFVPFLVVDIVVSAILMSLGMVMLPPSLISLPFKLLLFVLVDGWSLIVTTLIGSYR